MQIKREFDSDCFGSNKIRSVYTDVPSNLNVYINRNKFGNVHLRQTLSECFMVTYKTNIKFHWSAA